LASWLSLKRGLKLALEPRGRGAVPHKAASRYQDSLREERLPKVPAVAPWATNLREVLQSDAAHREDADVWSAFEQAAARDERGGGEARVEAGGDAPARNAPVLAGGGARVAIR
jgi:hypothetical protein